MKLLPSSMLPFLIVTMILMTPVAWAGDSLRIVSDIDDTIKVTDVLDRSRAVRNGLFGETAFAGMPELYQTLHAELSPELTYLSGSPTFLRFRLKDFLEDRGFPLSELILRNWFKEGVTGPEYKQARLEALGNNAEPATWLLIGDDTEYDPEVYVEFETEQASRHRVAATYIRWVTGREIPAHQARFVTAFDIALSEYRAGRLERRSVLEVGDAVLASRDKNLMPDFVKCEEIPVQPDLDDLELAEVTEAILGRIRRTCAKRESR